MDADTIAPVGAARRPPGARVCAICGVAGPCRVSRATGLPRCGACVQRWSTCVRCGRAGHVGSGTLAEPVCPDCTSPATAVACPGCGRTAQIRAARCQGCALRARLLDLLGAGTGTVDPGLQPLHDSLAGHDRPATLLRWLARPRTAALLADLGSGRLEPDHAAFDAVAPGRAVEHLRAMLVAVGVMPDRDEHLARLQRWITTTLDGHPESGLLHRYAVWHLLRRLRERTRGRAVTAGQATVVRNQVNAAIALLDWAAARGRSLQTLTQADLDGWLATPGADRATAGHFARWARAQRLTSLRYPASAWDGPTGPLDSDARWDTARTLLADDTLATPDRVAGLLVLLYAQQVTTLTRLTVGHVATTSTGRTTLRLGRTPVELPEPLDTLVAALVADRRGHAALANPATSPWLFCGGIPGRPISPSRLAERLRAVGVHAKRDRSTALFTLAGQLPAALLAQLLGIHITSAVTWQHASAGDWTRYAADYARRSPAPAGPPPTRPAGYSEPTDI